MNRRLHCVSCSTSARACARRGPGRVSLSTRWSSGRRCARSISAHLEDERFDQLPGHTYTKGFLRVYADSLGLDGELYVDEYNSRYVGRRGGAALGCPTRSEPQSRAPAPASGIATRVIAVTARSCSTALVIAAWQFGGYDGAEGAGRERDVQPTPAAMRERRVVTAARGASFMEVRAARRSGHAALSAARSSAGGEAVHDAEADDHRSRRPDNVIVSVAGVRVRCRRAVSSRSRGAPR